MAGDWTLETLKVFVIEKFASQERALQAAMASSEKAIIKAEAATEKRFDSVNEFRAQLKDQSLTFITRHEVDQRLSAIEKRLSSHEKDQADTTSETHGKTSITGPLWALGGAVMTSVFAGVIIWLITTFVKK
jgi:hypothetical protein